MIRKYAHNHMSSVISNGVLTINVNTFQDQEIHCLMGDVTVFEQSLISHNYDDNIWQSLPCTHLIIPLDHTLIKSTVKCYQLFSVWSQKSRK